MKRYLLPCSCGQSVEVDAGQAGLRVTCGCGASLEVPTMRGLSQLPAVEAGVEAEQAAAAPNWGPRQGLIFLGAVILVCGLIGLAVLYPNRPKWVIQEEMIDMHVQALSAGQVWERWQELRKGLGEQQDPIRVQYEADWATYYRRLTLAAIPAAVGLLMIVGGLLLPRSKAKLAASDRGTPSKSP